MVADAFAELGDVVTLPASQIDAAAVRDADLLLCRTTIRVGPALLEGSKVRFVATATIGTDHMDLPWLEARGIRWASAPGSNAASVALWWASALAIVCARRDLDPAALRIGIVGVGHVGKRIEALARALGSAPLLCDPPRARAEGASGFVALDEVLERCDLVSVHVPLTRGGDDATVGLLDAARLGRMRMGAILVNACRGEVVDGPALTDALAAERLTGVLDVFPGEPNVNPALALRADLITPHIAGYSIQGKLNGTAQILAAFRAHFGLPEKSAVRFPVPEAPEIVWGEGGVSGSAGRTVEAEMFACVRRSYDIGRDDAELRAVLDDPEFPKHFDRLRKSYPVRHEFAGFRMLKTPPEKKSIAEKLTRLGFSPE
jgi:erythronate-4-phosphate dehydrogenase